MPRKSTTSLVYSTATGGLCAHCGKRLDRCQCNSASSKSNATGDKIIIAKSTKGRAGKPVTTISGLPLDTKALKTLAKQLKTQCGVGGTVDQNVIELQGEQRQKVQILLEKLGWKAKVSGG